MRIWDLDPDLLCDRHLLGEHRELHAIWSVLTTGRTGYSNHPETRRWRGRLAALYARHDEQVAEMDRRGFRHASPLDPRLATGAAQQTELVDPVEAQATRLAGRGCGCRRRLQQRRLGPRAPLDDRGSRTATLAAMPTIPQKELRNNVADVLRRAEAGEEFTITVAGRPVAHLGPTQRRRWVSGPDLARVWETPAPETLADDLERFPAALSDPFE